MTKKAKKSFGGDYDCFFEWPENCYVQCGDKGIVGSSKGVYETAFFEAFPKEPSTFIRGEGANIKDAEYNAWQKYNKYLACNHHEYKRHREDSEHGICIHCGLFTSHVFAPVYQCSVCQKNEVALAYDKEHYCLEHFISEMPKFSLSNFSEDEYNERGYLLFTQCEALRLDILCKLNLIDLSVEEYKEINKWNKITDSFSTYFHNKIIEEAKNINIGLTIFEHMRLKNKISQHSKIYQQIFINYLNEEIKDLNLDIKDVSLQIQDYIKKEKL